MCKLMRTPDMGIVHSDTTSLDYNNDGNNNNNSGDANEDDI